MVTGYLELPWKPPCSRNSGPPPPGSPTKKRRPGGSRYPVPTRLLPSRPCPNPASQSGRPESRLGVMELDFERCYRAVDSRDQRFDGWFYTAVKTTGIYCRPSCPASTPKAHNVTFPP